MRTDRERWRVVIMRAGDAGHQWTLVLLLFLALQPLVASAAGSFEVQVRQWGNSHGLLHDGQCCDPQDRGGCDPCDTFFRACLKEYQARVSPSGACTYGSGVTRVLGGNSHTLHHHPSEGSGQITIPFKYAWPKSFSLVLEALDQDNDTSGGDQLMERVLLSSMLNAGEQWQSFHHHGRTFSLEYRLRFRCDGNYYGPLCTKLCRARDDFFGHFHCDAAGSKVCKEGWSGDECTHPLCKQGCHLDHGSCDAPGECKCHYGWKGDLCDQCETFPGCVHGSCTDPWKCVCDTNWGGLLCDKDLNFCGNHHPCRNGGTCTNTEPNEYLCVCQEGFRGRNCDIVEHACLSSPCVNAGVCVENPSGFSCVCAQGWTGTTCASAVFQCESSPCGRGATCRETPQGFQCVCPPFWTGRTCQLDTNECETGVCVHVRSCRNLIGGYLCDCLPGWSGTNCDIRNVSCPGVCQNGGRCEDSGCVCVPGFTGTLCQTELRVCGINSCLNSGRCVEPPLGRGLTCSCPPGYSGTYCEVELDFCNPNPCPQGASCQSREGGYVCPSVPASCEPHCRGAVSDPGGGRLGVYMVLVGVLALLVVGVCSACALLMSRLHRRQPTKDQEEQAAAHVNNQRPFCTLIRNLERSEALAPPPGEELELAPPSPLLKAHDKLDICNRQREKLNRLQELQV